MATVEELIGFPTGEDYDIYKGQHGGATIQLVQLADIKERGDDAMILLRDRPANSTTTSLSDFANNSGLGIDSVVAINGNTVSQAFNLPGEANDFNKYLFIVPAGKVVNDNKTVLKVQMLFLTLFHHLLFLGHATKHTELPNFNETFEEKFTKLQDVLKSQDAKTAIFGEPVAVLKTYFEKMRTTYNYYGKIHFEDMMKYIQASPKEILDFFRGELAGEVGSTPSATPAATAPAAAPAAAPAVPPSAPPALEDGDIDPDNIANTLSVHGIFPGPPLSLVTSGDIHPPPQNNNANSMTTQSNNTAAGFENMSQPNGTVTDSSVATPQARRPSPHVSPTGTNPVVNEPPTGSSSSVRQPNTTVLRQRSTSASNRRSTRIAAAAARPGSVTRSNRSRRSVRIGREHSELEYNPEAPPSIEAALAAGTPVQPSNAPSLSVRRGLAQPARSRLRQNEHPGTEEAAPPPLPITSPREGLTGVQAVLQSQARARKTPQAARNEANRLSNELSQSNSKEN